MKKYNIEITREQHTSVTVNANDEDEAITKVEKLCDDGLLEALEWYYYDDGVSLEIVD